MRIFGIVLGVILLVYSLPVWLTLLYEVFEESIEEINAMWKVWFGLYGKRSSRNRK